MKGDIFVDQMGLGKMGLKGIVFTLPTSPVTYSHFAYMFPFCLQMCIILSSYGYDLEGFQGTRTDFDLL